MNENIKQDKRSLKNYQMYRCVPITDMEHLAYLSGLDTNEDLFWIDHYIRKANSILELGAGYGRVLDFIRWINRDCSLYAVEMSPHFCKILKKKHPNSAEIWNKNILSLRVKNYDILGVDLITWMWGSIMDLSDEQQYKSLGNLKEFLAPNGTFVIETPCLNEKKLEERLEHIGKYIKESTGETYYCNIPSIDKMKEYALGNGYSRISHLSYPTKRFNRIIHILKK